MPTRWTEATRSAACGCGHDHAASYGPFLAARPQPLLPG